MSEDSSVILLTADLGFGAFDIFERFRNKQYFNVGVSEQLMASMAAGFASEGFSVFIYSIGVFPTMRCLEQIRNDISYHDLSVTIVSSGAGFSYGALGMTHHCVQDIGIMRSIPGINIFTPANNTEMNDILDIEKEIKYIRIDKSELDLKPIIVSPSYEYYCYYTNNNLPNYSKILVLSHGSIASIVLPLLNNKYKFDLYTIPHLNETKQLLNLCKEYNRIITIEEHSEVNGFFNFISSILSKYNINKNISFMALPHHHSSVVGDQSYLRDFYGLTSSKLKEKLMS
tara:strand:- start:11914 stop:12771 length:858 start_codon:yes stop_codon:yes gene_type:complete